MSAIEPSSEPIGRSLRATVELFEDELADVRFPDVSALVLRERAVAVSDRAEAVEAAREALARAEAELVAERASFTALVARALAYARIYAEGHPELRERLDALAAGNGPAAPKKRGRPRKQRDDAASSADGPPPGLPFEAALDEATAAR